LTVTIDLVSSSPLIVKESRYGQDQKELWSDYNDKKKQGMPDVIPISRSTELEIKSAVTHGSRRTHSSN